MGKASFYFSDGPYLQALEGLYAGLATPEAFVKLLGMSRTGKSSLCEKLRLILQHKGYRVVYFHYAIESPELLRAMLARELDLPNSVNFSRMLEAVPEVADGKPLILIFDDAHMLSEITLLEIYRLAETQLGSSRMLNILLCGEPALEQKLLNKRELKSLLLQVSHKLELYPMSPEVVSQFLIDYLQKAGVSGLQLEAAALNYFYKTCKGYPGIALALCELLVAARKEDSEQTLMSKEELSGLVQQSNRSGSGYGSAADTKRQFNQWAVFGPVAVVLIIFSLGMLYRYWFVS